MRWKRNPAYIPFEERGRVRKRGAVEDDGDDRGRGDGAAPPARFPTPLRVAIAVVSIALIAVFVANGSYAGAVVLAAALVANEVLVRRGTT